MLPAASALHWHSAPRPSKHAQLSHPGSSAAHEVSGGPPGPGRMIEQYSPSAHVRSPHWNGSVGSQRPPLHTPSRMPDEHAVASVPQSIAIGRQNVSEKAPPGASSLSTWLHRIAVNTAKNYLVAQNRRPPTDDIDAGDAEQFDTGARLRDTDTPEHELLRQEIELTVMRVVEGLPEELKAAITLREVDGLSYEEIAQKMGCPIGTVRSRIFRAREAIDAELRPLLDNDTAGPAQP